MKFLIPTVGKLIILPCSFAFFVLLFFFPATPILIKEILMIGPFLIVSVPLQLIGVHFVFEGAIGGIMFFLYLFVFYILFSYLIACIVTFVSGLLARLKKDRKKLRKH